MSIYLFLKENPNSSVGDIVQAFELTQPTISYHLNEMKDQGLLMSEKRGKEVIYSVSDYCNHHNRNCLLKSLNIRNFSESTENVGN